MEPINAMLNGRRLKQFIDDRQAETRDRYGLNRVELEAILYFSANPGAAAIDLHREMGMNKGQISKALDHLRQENYMTARTDPQDRRLMRWTLMEKGKQVSCVLQKQKREIVEVILQGVTQEERAALGSAFAKIKKNIEELVK